jgi:predicted nucleotidyltransferase
MRDHCDFGEYVRPWRDRLAGEERQQRKQMQYLRQVAETCAHRLVQEFGAHQVYLFGSLLDETLVQDRSDIDLAVEGLEDRLYWEALRTLTLQICNSRRSHILFTKADAMV